MSDMLKRVAEDIKKHEGFKSKPYRCTAGKLTIGFGTNIEYISTAEGDMLFDMRFKSMVNELAENLEWFSSAPDAIKESLINMGYNLGWPRLSKFKNMLAAMESKYYCRAATEALDSKWASQVGKRAEDIANTIRSA